MEGDLVYFSRYIAACAFREWATSDYRDQPSLLYQEDWQFMDGVAMMSTLVADLDALDRAEDSA